MIFMENFSLRDCLIPELLKWKIDFRILRYKNGDKSLPESLMVHYKYINVCRVDCANHIGLNACYQVVWYTKKPSSLARDNYYSRACELVRDIRKVIDFNFKQNNENKGEDKMNNKLYKVTDIEFKSTPYAFDEINFTVNVMRERNAWREDADRIREAIESIKMHEDSIDALSYCKADVISTYRLVQMFGKTSIKDVIFNNPATIVFWDDGTKTVVKAENEEFDPEKGLAMAIAKKALGNNYDYYDIFKKYVGRYDKKQKKGGK